MSFNKVVVLQESFLLTVSSETFDKNQKVFLIHEASITPYYLILETTFSMEQNFSNSHL